MKNREKKLATAMCALALAFAGRAEIKYWDNPKFKAFDAGDYVQNGLVLNYDGILNAGAGEEHDPDATTWKNLGSGGSDYDMTLGGAAANSGWGGDGYVFAGDAYFKSASKQALPEYYEIQTLVDAKASDHTGIGYIYTRVFADTWNNSDTAWNGSSIAVRPAWSQTVSGTTYKGSLVFNTHYYTNGRPMVPTSSATTYDYITALGDSKAAALFTGIEEPVSMPGRASAQSGAWAARAASYIYLGAHDNGAGVGEALKGTIKNFRCYSRILSEDERAWNRVVDEARYFGRTAALPVTNVVVASNIPIVSGVEPVGRYAVDGSHVFSAPASKVVKGRTYTLNGYTIETWNDASGTWDEPVSHPGESSCAATETSRFRLTWQWTAGDGLVAYDADDYVQDGLVLHYDGIRNAGLDAPHDSAATTWVNLGNGGAAYDMTRYSLVSGAMVSGDATGSWADDGFAFAKNAFFYESESLTVQPCYTLQTVIEATANDQNGVGYVMAPSKTYNSNDPLRFSIGLRDTSFDYGDATLAYSFYHNALDTTDGRPAVPVSLDEKVKYGTAMLDRTDGVFFTGTTPPWDATGASNGHAAKTSGTSSARTYGGLTLGGNYNYTTDMFAGTIHDFRFYDRVLSDAEVAWNRIVDEARYFTEPNVVVASTRADVQANEADGEYGVSGSYTFTAPESVKVGNITYAPAGYAVQQWDSAAGCWGAASEYPGASYVYTTAAGKVRLLWRWKAVSGIRTAADYDVSDYVAGGLTFHLDGIRNAGAAASHAEAPATWVNLGTSGASGDTTIRSGDAAKVVNWNDKGFRFDGNTRFFGTIPYTATFTLQLLTDAVQNEQHNPDSAHMYPFTADNNGFALSTYDTRLYFRTQGNGAEYALGFGIDKESPIGYITAMLDDAAKTARIFRGTTSSAGGSKTYESMSDAKYASLTLGGGGSGASQFWIGTINYFRYYDRILSDAELAQNREVDEARYFGRLSATNVVVSVNGVETPCKVEGTYTFSAPATVEVDSEAKPVAGCFTEELVDGEWKRKEWHDGVKEYTYDTAAAEGKTIRLTWSGPRPGMLLIVR